MSTHNSAPRELGWEPLESFEMALRRTVEWYLNNEAWWRPILERSYQSQRLGIHDTATDSQRRGVP